MAANILLTGKPGIGKTTAIQCIAGNLDPSDLGGFWSSEIREHGRRVGFSIQTIDGASGVLAHSSLVEGPRVGKYKVNVGDIERVAVPSMRSARERGLVVLVDEIAKMELFSSAFRAEIVRCLDSGCVLGTIQMRGDPFLDAIRARPDVKVIEITQHNRGNIPEMVLEMLL